MAKSSRPTLWHHHHYHVRGPGSFPLASHRKPTLCVSSSSFWMDRCWAQGQECAATHFLCAVTTLMTPDVTSQDPTRQRTTCSTGFIRLHNFNVGAAWHIRDEPEPCNNPTCLTCPTKDITPRYHGCMCGGWSRERTCSTPLSSSSSSSERSQDVEPRTALQPHQADSGALITPNTGCWCGIIHATCCWYTTEAPPSPNPLPLSWRVRAPGGLQRSRAVLRQRVPAGRVGGAGCGSADRSLLMWSWWTDADVWIHSANRASV